jgi:hypothetical protein
MLGVQLIADRTVGLDFIELAYLNVLKRKQFYHGHWQSIVFSNMDT